MTATKSLEEFRLEAGLSRAKVSADMDMSERHLFRLEKGITPLRRYLALQFARYYGVPVDAISEANQ